ncbi:MAG: alpha/beta hydrolase [bacterium]
MKNALILHGTGNNSQGNWFPWLGDELRLLGWKVWVPNLPDSDAPNTKKYNDFILSNHDWKFDDQSFLIGHSSGAVAILGLLSVLPETVKVDTCILVGSFKDPLGVSKLNDLFEVPFDFEKIKKHAKKFIFIHSDNDPYCPLDHAQYLAQKLGGELIIIKGQGHFNLENGQKYKQFPELLQLINSQTNKAE